jgi:hypothetical protein
MVKNHEVGVAFNGIMLIPSFVKAGSKVKKGGTHTGTGAHR